MGSSGYSWYQNLANQENSNKSLHEEIRILENALKWSQRENTIYHTILMGNMSLPYVEIPWDQATYQEITVNESDTIRFVNRSSSGMIVNILPPSWELGTGSSITLGGEQIIFYHPEVSGIYTFTAGTSSWIIIVGVSAKREYDTRTFLDHEVLPLLDDHNPDSIRTALAHFRTRIESDPMIAAECHNFAHRVGHEAFEKYGFAASITRSEDDICAWGFTHGIIESYFLSFPELRNHPESTCESIQWEKKDSCYHGVGHGLMFVSRNSVTTSIVGCRTLSRKSWQNRCAEWVFMELYSWDLEHVGGMIGYAPEDLFAPCLMYANESESSVCAFYAGLGYMRYNTSDYSGALRICHSGWPYTNTCIRGVGREIAKRHIADAHILEKLCSDLNNENEKGSCILGGINYTKFQFDDNPEKIHDYCQWFSDMRKYCTNETGIDSVIREK